MGRRKPAPSYTPPRPVDAWEMDAPELPDDAYALLCEAGFDNLIAPLERALAYLEPAVTSDDALDDPHTGLESIRETIAGLKAMTKAADRAMTWADDIRAHATAVKESVAELADRVSEADELRDAIERHPGTAPGVWRDALLIARSGADVRDMFCPGGKS